MMASASIRGDWVRSLLNYAIIAVVIGIDVLDPLSCFLHRDKRSSEKSATTAHRHNKMVAFFTFCVGIQIVVTGIAKIFHLTAL